MHCAFILVMTDANSNFYMNCSSFCALSQACYVDVLFRGLEFMGLFLAALVSEHDSQASGGGGDSLQPACLAAYERSLKPYHGWLAGSVFSVST